MDENLQATFLSTNQFDCIQSFSGRYSSILNLFHLICIIEIRQQRILCHHVVNFRRMQIRSHICFSAVHRYSSSLKTLTNNIPIHSAPRYISSRAISLMNSPADVPHVDAAWEWFNSLGAPKYWVAPMVDQSELPFRMLCRKYGSTAAYTPMLHARLFLETESYREEHFSTCPEDRPLLAQFCANDPDILLKAARIVEPYVDGIDINLGCPQRIARRGRYGAYLMDDLPLVEKLVKTLAQNLSIPVTVKIRRFDDIQKTVQYALMLERAGASMIAVHGRTRDQRRASEVLADWAHITAVRQACRVPVLANGNIRTLQDVDPCLQATQAHGVLSAESLLEDPALFWSERLLPGNEYKMIDRPMLFKEYLDLVDKYPVNMRMVKGHAFKILGPWLTEYVDLREEINKGSWLVDVEAYQQCIKELMRRIELSKRDYPVPQISAR